MAKAPGLSKLQQGKILAYASVKMTVRAIAKAVGRFKSVVHAFLKDPDGYGTKKSPGRPRQLKTHDRTRLRRYAATGEYTANELQKELCIDVSVRTVQRELQHCEHVACEKANKSPCMTERHMKLRVVMGPHVPLHGGRCVWDTSPSECIVGDSYRLDIGNTAGTHMHR